MNDKTKTILALMQIDNLTKLLEGNEYDECVTGGNPNRRRFTTWFIGSK